MDAKKKGHRRVVTAGWIRAAKGAVRTGDFGSRSDIAKVIGVSPGYISNLLNGRYQSSCHLDDLTAHLRISRASFSDAVDDPLLRRIIKNLEAQDVKTLMALEDLLNQMKKS